MTRFMKDNQGRGRSRDADRFLEMHKDVIEDQANIDDVKNQANRARQFYDSLPPFLKILFLLILILGIIVCVPVGIIVVMQIMMDFGLKRRLGSIMFVAAIAVILFVFIKMYLGSKI